MNTVLAVLTAPLRLLTPSRARRARPTTPLVPSPMSTPDYDTKPLERL